MELPQGHLSYCTNIHPGEDWPGHFAALKQNFPSIKRQVSPETLMGIGLRLSNAASLELAERDALEEFKHWLRANDAYVFTMNGFPYGEFHNTVVKDDVHTPDWTTEDRLNYTIRMFNILAELLPAGMDGGISTSPISYKYWHKTDADLQRAKEQGTINILKVAEHLATIQKDSGIYLHLDIEPEPDGMLENGDEYIEWYSQTLLPLSKTYFAEHGGLTTAEAELLIRNHITLCYDVCHFAIGYEQHRQVVSTLREQGLKVGKIQISAALRSALPKSGAERNTIVDEFARYNEPVYLHQVVARTSEGNLLRYPDLPEAMADKANTAITEWRAHFHVPIFKDRYDLLQSTQTDIVEVLKLQKEQAFTNHLEVETYTWGVLPDADKLPMADSISREVNWVKDQLSK